MTAVAARATIGGMRELGPRTPAPGVADPNASIRVPFQKWIDGECHRGADPVVVEEPIEYQVLGRPVATVMRTPGDDRDLAIGFFYGEGWISCHREVGALCLGARTVEGPATGAATRVSVANLLPSGGAALAIPDRTRPGPVLSSCGVCGKLTVEEILASVPHRAIAPAGGIELEAEVVAGLPAALRRRQPVFHATGALHAAGIFDLRGAALEVCEDIGRHNAVDKVVGRFVRRDSVPLARHALLVSGRASFEIIQKALRAGIPFVIAVSGVSHLASELADRGGITLCGFARGRSFSVYSHPGRIRG